MGGRGNLQSKYVVPPLLRHRGFLQAFVFTGYARASSLLVMLHSRTQVDVPPCGRRNLPSGSAFFWAAFQHAPFASWPQSAPPCRGLGTAPARDTRCGTLTIGIPRPPPF